MMFSPSFIFGFGRFPWKTVVTSNIWVECTEASLHCEPMTKKTDKWNMQRTFFCLKKVMDSIWNHVKSPQQVTESNEIHGFKRLRDSRRQLPNSWQFPAWRDEIFARKALLIVGWSWELRYWQVDRLKKLEDLNSVEFCWKKRSVFIRTTIPR